MNDDIIGVLLYHLRCEGVATVFTL